MQSTYLIEHNVSHVIFSFFGDQLNLEVEITRRQVRGERKGIFDNLLFVFSKLRQFVGLQRRLKRLMGDDGGDGSPTRVNRMYCTVEKILTMPLKL